jgi:hypothetical protein
MEIIKRIKWKRIDREGSEVFELVQRDEGWLLRGTVELEGKTIPYAVMTDPSWETTEVAAGEWRVTVDDQKRWWARGEELEHLRGCVDADLAITPSTNTLPIRRLNLAVGASAKVNAAWLTWPEMEWRVLEQEYERRSQEEYEYRSRGGQFVRQLRVDSNGVVLEYPDFWIQLD